MPGWVRPKQFQCILVAAHFVNPRPLWSDPRMHLPSCWPTSGRSDQIVQLEHWPPTAMAGHSGPGLGVFVRHPALYSNLIQRWSNDDAINGDENKIQCYPVLFASRQVTHNITQTQMMEVWLPVLILFAPVDFHEVKKPSVERCRKAVVHSLSHVSPFGIKLSNIWVFSDPVAQLCLLAGWRPFVAVASIVVFFCGPRQMLALNRGGTVDGRNMKKSCTSW